MELFQCDECEKIYAVEPSIHFHSCPYCQGDNHIIGEGTLTTENGN